MTLTQIWNKIKYFIAWNFDVKVIHNANIPTKMNSSKDEILADFNDEGLQP